MKEIIEVANLPEQEKVYIAKDMFKQWHVVYPLKNQDGSWNWKNILTGGSWFDFLLITGMVIIFSMLFFEYSSNLAFCKDLLGNQLLKIP